MIFLLQLQISSKNLEKEKNSNNESRNILETWYLTSMTNKLLGSSFAAPAYGAAYGAGAYGAGAYGAGFAAKTTFAAPAAGFAYGKKYWKNLNEKYSQFSSARKHL